jgi:hypothetical protein
MAASSEAEGGTAWAIVVAGLASIASGAYTIFELTFGEARVRFLTNVAPAAGATKADIDRLVSGMASLTLNTTFVLAAGIVLFGIGLLGRHRLVRVLARGWALVGLVGMVAIAVSHFLCLRGLLQTLSTDPAVLAAGHTKADLQTPPLVLLVALWAVAMAWYLGRPSVRAAMAR